jgi:hypothetical protein
MESQRLHSKDALFLVVSMYYRPPSLHATIQYFFPAVAVPLARFYDRDLG